MKHRKIVVAVALLALAALSFPLLADEDEDEHEAKDAAKVYAGLLKDAKVTLTDAVKTAETKTGGSSVVAVLEKDDGVLMYEVLVVLKGEKPGLREVEVDAKTGKVIEVEDPLAEDDEKGDDDGDDEGDEGEEDDD